MKTRKTYALIPEEKLSEFMRLVPTARLYAWPNTWSFATTFKPTVDAFLASSLNPAGESAAGQSTPLDVTAAASPDRALSVMLSASELHALERVLKNIPAGTVAAMARNENEQVVMQRALTALKAVLRRELQWKQP